MIDINDTEKVLVELIIKKYVPNKIHSILHINPYDEMKQLVFILIKENILSLDTKSITIVCKEWKTLLYKKYSLFN
jgi:hypothetical protein